MIRIIKLNILLILLFFVGCSGDIKDYKKLMQLLSDEQSKIDVSNNCKIDFNKLTYVDFRHINKVDPLGYLEDNMLYGIDVFYMQGKAVYNDYSNVRKINKGRIEQYSILHGFGYDMGKEFFYYKGEIYFFKLEGFDTFDKRFALAKYSIKKNKSIFKKIYSLKRYEGGGQHFLRGLKIQACINDKLYITANRAIYESGSLKFKKAIFLIYDLKTKKAKLIGEYDFFPHFRIGYAGKKVVIIYDYSGIYAIDLKNGNIIYKYKSELLSPPIVNGGEIILYNYPVYYNNALYLIVPIKRERATKIVRIDKNGEKVVHYIPSFISLVARAKNKIYFVESKFFIVNKDGYINANYFYGEGANITCFNLKTLKNEWKTFVKTKYGGGMANPVLTKKEVVVSLGKKIVVLNRFTGKVKKVIPLKVHFSANLTCTENRISALGDNNILIIGENQKSDSRLLKVTRYDRYYGKRTYFLKKNGKMVSFRFVRKKTPFTESLR